MRPRNLHEGSSIETTALQWFNGIFASHLGIMFGPGGRVQEVAGSVEEAVQQPGSVHENGNAQTLWVMILTQKLRRTSADASSIRLDWQQFTN